MYMYIVDIDSECAAEILAFTGGACPEDYDISVKQLPVKLLY